MNQIDSTQLYQSAYNAFGVIIQTPMVEEVLENKHGIDNPVIDLNIGEDTLAGFVLDPVSGDVDDTNTTFAFSVKPTLVAINGSVYRENHGWTWDGFYVIIDTPAGVGGDVYGLA